MARCSSNSDTRILEQRISAIYYTHKQSYNALSCKKRQFDIKQAVERWVSATWLEIKVEEIVQIWWLKVKYLLQKCTWIQSASLVQQVGLVSRIWLHLCSQSITSLRHGATVASWTGYFVPHSLQPSRRLISCAIDYKTSHLSPLPDHVSLAPQAMGAPSVLTVA